jgi:hypothetical protein
MTLPFDKYDLYQKSVQTADLDAEFAQRAYRELKQKEPTTLGEDFCGTWLISREWVRLNPDYKAVCVDIDKEPLEYGNQHNKITSSEKRRLKIIRDNVLTKTLPKVDIVNAQNFSYWIFKTREELVNYFKVANLRCRRNGILLVDAFGGPECCSPNIERTRHNNFVYQWEQVNFNPTTNEALFYINFKVANRIHRGVFEYDWRIWSIAEIREAMMEAGFRKTTVWMENEDDEYVVVDDCDEESWLAIIIGEK